MNILLTNDDGIRAQGLCAIYRELCKIGRVVVVAPDSQRSSVGHGITLGRPLQAREIRTRGGVKGIGLSGTPADCVKFALRRVCRKKPDVVVSGINLGGNEGCSVFYSGTVAAAREAALNGVLGIAVSLNTFQRPDFSFSARFASTFVASMVKQKIPRGVFLNVNIPACAPQKVRGVQWTRQGTEPLRTIFVKGQRRAQAYSCWMDALAPLREKKSATDTAWLKKNFITISPLQNDLTDQRTLTFLRRQSDIRI